jgi:hypothetical protein
MTEEQFREMCVKHDLTYDYSDDGSVWRRGAASYQKVRAAAQELGMDKAKQIWNEVVDSKLRPEGREQFYWK